MADENFDAWLHALRAGAGTPSDDDLEARRRVAAEADAFLASLRSAEVIRLPSRGNGSDRPETPPSDIVGAEAFMAGHSTPDWLVHGIVQTGRLYACTSLTGHGKTAVWLFNACMIHASRMIGRLDVESGNVLFLAGENPTDLEARMLGMCRAYGIPPARMPYVLPGPFPLSETGAQLLADKINGKGIPFALIVGDTAASFFPGDDENDNVQAGAYARALRTLTRCHGNPAVIVLSHPTKNATRENLLPRGGGAFLNELDGNLTLWINGEITTLHWCGKIRGPEFPPLSYRLRPVPTGLQDKRGRDEITVVAETMSEEAAADHAKQNLANEDAVLLILRDHPDFSYAQIARHAGWLNDEDEPLRARVQRAVASLASDKLIHKPRAGADWELTPKGRETLNGHDHE